MLPLAPGRRGRPAGRVRARLRGPAGHDRELALRAWLYRVAHNRCIDQLRRPAPPPPEVLQLGRPPPDPLPRRTPRVAAAADRRRAPAPRTATLGAADARARRYVLRRRRAGARRLGAGGQVAARPSPGVLGGRRRGPGHRLRGDPRGAGEAHDRRVRPNAMARRHLRDCPGCREFRGELRGVRRPARPRPDAGPCGVLARMLGGGGRSAAGGGAAAACGGAGASGMASTTGLLASAGRWSPEPAMWPRCSRPRW